MEAVTTQQIMLYLLGINLVTLGAYWLDKRASMRGGWRISEKALLGFVFLGGVPGAILASRLFRHKTKKSSYRAKFILVVMLQIILMVAYCTQRPQ